MFAYPVVTWTALPHSMPPQDNAVGLVHFIGAHLVFACGTVYMWLQTYISYRIYHASLTRHFSSVVIVLRLLISIMATVTYILSELYKHTHACTHTQSLKVFHTHHVPTTLTWFVVYEYQYWQCCLVYVSADKWCE